MKALQEIGIVKIIRFILYTFWKVVFDCLLFPNLRVFWLQLFGAKIGHNTIIHRIHLHNIYHNGLANLVIGDSCFVADNVSFDLAEKIEIGAEVNIAEGVILSTHLKVGYKNHPLQKYFPIYRAPITIEKGVFIGVGSTILAGSNLGNYAFISAGTVISGIVPAWTLVKTGNKNLFISIQKKNNEKK